MQTSKRSIWDGNVCKLEIAQQFVFKCEQANKARIKTGQTANKPLGPAEKKAQRHTQRPEDL
jgi:hypothetical protein